MKLFEPVQVGTMSLKNRLVMPPMDVRLANADGTVGDRCIGYYGARARGGVGMVIVEVVSIDSDWRHAEGEQICCDDDRFIPGLSRLAQAIQAGGAKAALQIGHPGPHAHNLKDPAAPLLAPVSIKPAPYYPSLRQLTTGEIAGMVEAWARCAKRAQRAGFDAVEIHGAHGYLLSTFLSPYYNRREDEYGGDVYGRARFLFEVVSAVRRECGLSYPVLVRMNGDDEEEVGITIEETAIVARKLEEAGVVAVDISHGSRRGRNAAKTMPPACFPEGVNLRFPARIKQAVGIPVIGVGGIRTPATAEKAVREGMVDLVALGRTLIADPEWPNKYAAGREDEIVPCLACLRCTRLIDDKDSELICSVNPAAGREADFTITPASSRKNVAVVGGGPGGMEAARVAALRGHAVTLYEKGSALGGQLIAGAKPPFKLEVERLRSYYVGQMAKCGVKVQLGHYFSVETVEREKPDAVIVAAGASAFIPDIPGVNGQNVVTAEAVLLGKPVGHKVVVIGGDSTGCETAEYLAEMGKSVTILRRGDRFATDLQQEAPVRSQLLRRLREGGVVLKPSIRSYEAITERGLTVINEEGKRVEIEADTVVLATGMRRRDALRRELEGKVAELYSVGDCVEPRDIMAAVREGAIIGRTISWLC